MTATRAADAARAASSRSPSTGGTVHRRILEATRETLSILGPRRFALSEIATRAGVSRTTLYNHFASKEALLAAVSRDDYEQFNKAMAEALRGRRGRSRLEAALYVVAEFQQTYRSRQLIALEPTFVLDQLRRAQPVMQSALVSTLRNIERDAPGSIRGDIPKLAAAITRTALGHFMFPDPDATVIHEELRAIAGVSDTA